MTQKIFSAPPVPEYEYSEEIKADAAFMLPAVHKMQEKMLAEDNVNHVYSPFSLYLCACILARTAGGKCREQLYHFLGSDEKIISEMLPECVKTNTYKCSRSFYDNTSIIGSSVWINERLEHSEELLEALRDTLNTDAFLFDAEASDAEKAVQSWIKEHTGGKLKRSNKQSFGKDSAFSILSSVYLNQNWRNQFWEMDTKKGIFYARTQKVSCKFMESTAVDCVYYGSNFTAYKKLAGSNFVWFILPDKGCTFDDVLDEGSYLKMMNDPKSFTYREAEVTFRVPKFDISADYDMVNIFRSIGVTDIFDGKTCDLSGLIRSDEEMFVDKFTHSVRASVNEYGIEAAALSEAGVACGCIPPQSPEKILFELDRPFLFAVTGRDHSILLSGAVNDPTV